ncbi:MAG TPA: hypothetical protein VK989_00775 [Polyangia bacterium]|nr:hypothetical protein [Polyangia bacterium]
MDKVRAAVADLDESFDWGRLGRRHDAIPLLLTIGTMIFLRIDGTFLEYEGDPLPERLVRESPDIDAVALAWGIERYPWLSELLPSRPADSQECAACGGIGRVGFKGSHYIYCPACAALGWVSAG